MGNDVTGAADAPLARGVDTLGARWPMTDDKWDEEATLDDGGAAAAIAAAP